MVTDVLQVTGALGVLVPFVLLQLRRLHPRSLPYLVPNLAGAGLLAVLAALGRDWGFLLLETVWSLVAAYGIFATLTHRSPADPADGA
ncbi:MAG TPA: hypothetical protein VM754_12435 [Actinomycetota bacterium]|nr:hypothetical protein [Actinomycetota bacterium]